MTPGERDQRLPDIAHTVGPQHLRWDVPGQVAQLAHEPASLVEQAPVEITVGDEPEEGPRLANDPAESLAPDEREQARRYDQEQEHQERAAAAEPPDQPALDAPEQRIDHETDRHLVRRLLLERSPEPFHDLSGQPVGHGVTGDPPARQGQAERQPQYVGHDVGDHEAGRIRLAELVAGDPDLIKVAAIELDPVP